VGNGHKIYAITISKNYAKILDIAISENADYFEKWFIVTQEDDTDTIEVIKNHNKPNIELIYYPSYRMTKIDSFKTYPRINQLKFQTKLQNIETLKPRYYNELKI